MYQSTWGILHIEEIIIVDILFIVYVCICYHNCITDKIRKNATNIKAVRALATGLVRNGW